MWLGMIKVKLLTVVLFLGLPMMAMYQAVDKLRSHLNHTPHEIVDKKLLDACWYNNAEQLSEEKLAKMPPVINPWRFACGSFGSTGNQDIVKHIKNNPNLKALYVYFQSPHHPYDAPQDRDFIALLDAITTNKSIIYIKLGALLTPTTDFKMMHDFLEKLILNSNIVYLDIEKVKGLLDEEIMPLLHAIETNNCTLKGLWFNKSHCCTKNAEHLARLLERNRKMPNYQKGSLEILCCINMVDIDFPRELITLLLMAYYEAL